MYRAWEEAYFSTLSHICDGPFCENSERRKVSLNTPLNSYMYLLVNIIELIRFQCSLSLPPKNMGYRKCALGTSGLNYRQIHHCNFQLQVQNHVHANFFQWCLPSNKKKSNYFFYTDVPKDRCFENYRLLVNLNAQGLQLYLNNTRSQAVLELLFQTIPLGKCFSLFIENIKLSQHSLKYFILFSPASIILTFCTCLYFVITAKHFSLIRSWR